MAAAILLADMDAFFASVEQLDDSTLAGRPVLVGGSGRRAVVAAANYEARRSGARSAMSMAEARRRCPHAVVVPPRMKRYAELSARVREIFYRFTPLVEPLSLDEAYLDVSDSRRLHGGPLEIAEALRSAVRDELSLAVSVGGGPGKTVAKIASRRAKPDGVFLVAADEVLEFLQPLRLREVPGVGPVTERKLHEMGVATLGQLAELDPGLLEKKLGKSGPGLYDLAWGRDRRRVSNDRERSSYGSENTFNDDVEQREVIEAAVIAHSETVAWRLRRAGRCGVTVTLKYRPSGSGEGWRLVTRSRSLAVATDDGAVISREAMRLWDDEPRHPPLRLVGVQLAGFEAERAPQLDLFGEAEVAARDDVAGSAPSRTALNSALDDISARFGRGVLKRGA
ncbi:MAG: DNA polymerase IV [Proteobacteria bacterium]|nr:DNA polymerase IV [Pseudomonadota bacterium]